MRDAMQAGLDALKGVQIMANCCELEKPISAAIAQLEAALAAPVEPVAWMFMDGDHAQTDEPTDKTYFTPLYAAPVSRVISDELREAAQDLIDSLDAYPEQLVPIIRLSHTCRMLREALAKVEGK